MVSLTKDIYTGFRNEGIRPIEIRSKLDEINKEQLEVSLITAMIASLIVMTLYFVMFGNSLSFWVTSPSGRQRKELPLNLALRIIRKKRWTATEVEPIREVTRSEALRILIFGDKPFEERFQG
jgi:hypothetical protein